MELVETGIFYFVSVGRLFRLTEKSVEFGRVACHLPCGVDLGAAAVHRSRLYILHVSVRWKRGLLRVIALDATDFAGNKTSE